MSVGNRDFCLDADGTASNFLKLKGVAVVSGCRQFNAEVGAPLHRVVTMRIRTIARSSSIYSSRLSRLRQSCSVVWECPLVGLNDGLGRGEYRWGDLFKWKRIDSADVL